MGGTAAVDERTGAADLEHPHTDTHTGQQDSHQHQCSKTKQNDTNDTVGCAAFTLYQIETTGSNSLKRADHGEDQPCDIPCIGGEAQQEIDTQAENPDDGVNSMV